VAIGQGGGSREIVDFRETCICNSGITLDRVFVFSNGNVFVCFASKLFSGKWGSSFNRGTLDLGI
jgi:hypothetical protein